MSQLSEILHGDAASGDNSSSIVARLGQWGQKYTDPLAWIFGRKYTQPLVDIADFSNKQLSSVAQRDPMIKADQKYGPAAWFGLQKEGEWTKNKPADTLAMLAGAYFGGGALAGLGGGGGSAGAGSAGAGASSSSAGVGGGLGSVGAADTIPTVTVSGSSGGFGGPMAFTGGGGAGLGATDLYGNNPGPGNANSSDLFQRQLAGRTNFSTGQPTGGANSISNIPGADMPGSGTSPAGNMSTNDYIKIGMKLMGSGQQQSPATVMPQYQPRGQSFTPTPYGVSGQVPTQTANSGDAILQLALAAAAKQQSIPLGANSGFGQDLEGSFQTAYQKSKNARAARRTDNLDQSGEQQPSDASQNFVYGNLINPAWWA